MRRRVLLCKAEGLTMSWSYPDSMNGMISGWPRISLLVAQKSCSYRNGFVTPQRSHREVSVRHVGGCIGECIWMWFWSSHWHITTSASTNQPIEMQHERPSITGEELMWPRSWKPGTAAFQPSHVMEPRPRCCVNTHGNRKRFTELVDPLLTTFALASHFWPGSCVYGADSLRQCLSW